MDNDERIVFLEQAYRRFNRRQIDGLVHQLTDDVEWPDAATGEVLHGPDAVRQYWEGQFAVSNPEFIPHEFVEVADGIVVEVSQQVLSLDGEPLTPATNVFHRFTFVEDLVSRMVMYAGRAEAMAATP